MTLEELLQITATDTGRPDDFIRAVSDARGKSAYYEAQKQYDPKEHKVMKQQYRPDKIIREKTGTKDAAGNENRTTSIELVNRAPVPFQKLIVKYAVAHIAGNGITLSAPSDTEGQRKLVAAVKKFLHDNKMDFRNRDILRRLLSETEVAEVWYSRVDEDVVDLRCKVYSPSMDCKLYPVFDNQDNLIAFGIQTHSKLENKGIFDLYLEDEKITYENGTGVWLEVKRVPLPYGKIPVIYYQIPQPDWADVQPLIERLEKNLSNSGDTNDYHASPTLAFTGQVKGLAKKGEQGKVIQMDEGGKVEYVTWDGAGEATTSEMDRLEKYIYIMTQTINYSSEEMKGLGDISGTAWDRITTPANLKASDYQDGVFGEGIQRRINFLKAAAAAIPKSGIDTKLADETIINPVFSLFRPDDLADRVDIYTKALEGGVMTLTEAVEGVAVSTDVVATVTAIKEEQAKKTPTTSTSQQPQTATA